MHTSLKEMFSATFCRMSEPNFLCMLFSVGIVKSNEETKHLIISAAEARRYVFFNIKSYGPADKVLVLIANL